MVEVDLLISLARIIEKSINDDDPVGPAVLWKVHDALWAAAEELQQTRTLVEALHSIGGDTSPVGHE